MSEKRKPTYSILLRKRGNKNLKVELFDAKDFRHTEYLFGRQKRFRVRVNGRWYRRNEKEPYTFMTKWQFRDLLWRSFFK